MTMLAASTAPDNPAARAKGTVNPSDMPITMSRTVSDEVKCFSMCGVCGIAVLLLGSVNWRHCRDVAGGTSIVRQGMDLAARVLAATAWDCSATHAASELLVCVAHRLVR